MEEIRFDDNRIYAGNESLSFAELAHLCWAQRVSLSATGFMADYAAANFCFSLPQ